MYTKMKLKAFGYIRYYHGEVTVNDICSFWQHTDISGWGGKPPPPKILETTRRMTMEFLSEIKYYGGGGKK